MRNILFRGKRVDNNEWVEGYYFKTPLTDEATDSKPEDGWAFLSEKERHCISRDNCVYEIDPKTLGQYTGLHDRTKWKSLSEVERVNHLEGWNGRKIFEGDIIRVTFTDHYVFKKEPDIWSKFFEVVFDDVHHAWYTKLDNGKLGEWLCEYDWDCEVVGNVYDNNIQELR